MGTRIVIPYPLPKSVPVKTLRYYLCVLFLVTYTYAIAQTYYVKPVASGTGTGASWANAAGAAQLQGIISAAAAGSQVWVAAGVYHPTAYPAGSTGGATTRDYAFTLTTGVAVYGGFAGTETTLAQRNVTTNITSLSGDIGTVGVLTDNCYHVIATNGCTNTAILDGFKIDSGYANVAATGVTIGGQAFLQSEGAGMCAMKSQPSIANCTFISNQATSEGGAIYFSNCTAMPFTNCTFTSNQAGGNGGAISKETSSPLTFTGCTFTSNKTTVAAGTTGGGAIYSASGGNDIITSCTFKSNTSANAYGGALFYNATNNLTMTHTTITQNNAASFGGGMANAGGTQFAISNCNFNNNACLYGGGIYCSGGQCIFSYDTLANNTSTSGTAGGGGGFYNNGTNPTISHCIISGNVTNGGNGAGQYDTAGAAPVDSNTVFQANIASGTASNGGGYYHGISSGSSPGFVNCVFVDNKCTGNGGGYYNNSTQPISHCTFYNNTAGATYLGGGLFDEGAAVAKIYNNMIWGNTPDDFYSGGTEATGLKLKYNDFAEAASYATGGSVVGNIASAPSFFNSGSYTGADGLWATDDDGLHLESTYGTGGVGGVPPNGTNGSYGWAADDITGFLRPYPGPNADMGAYEGGANVLGLELLNFTAVAAATNTAVLSWQVAAPGQALSYQVQRSADAIDFGAVGTVADATNRTSYTFTDHNDTATVMYYRLQMSLPGGVLSYSPVVSVRNEQTVNLLQLRPSISTQSSITLFVGGASRPDQLQLLAVDATGRTRLSQSVPVAQGNNYIPLDVSRFTEGVYYVVVTDQTGFREVLYFEKP